MDRILRLNMTSRQMQIEPLPQAYRYLGGRALTSRVLLDEVDPGCDPLGPHNKLIFAPGLLAGTTLSSSNRISVGCKSPLTGGTKEASGGGNTALYLAQRGYRAIIVAGEAAPGDWSLLLIRPDGTPELRSAAHLAGLDGFATAAALQAEYGGKKAAIALIGRAGEMRLNLAGIGNTDPEGRPVRLCARGGVGAVMGAKGLKAIVIPPDKWQPTPALDPTVWRAAMKGYHQDIQAVPSTAKVMPEYGTAATLETVHKLRGLPTRNFSSGLFEAADAISGATLREVILARHGEGNPTHACMTGCAIRCSNVYPGPDGKEVASPLEFETLGLFGSNLGISDLDAIAAFTGICNDLCIDTIEAGGAIGVCMAAGLAAFGDAPAVVALLGEIRAGTLTGRLLGAGAATVGRVLGVTRVPVVKGQTMSAYDPRAIKGNGVTYATSPQGADHTAGNTVNARVDHLDPRDKVALSRGAQIANTLMDYLGFCVFARGPLTLHQENLLGLFNSRTGAGWTWESLQRLSREIIQWEIEFNRRAGLTPAHDRLPEWMCEEPLPPHNTVFDIPATELDLIWAE